MASRKTLRSRVGIGVNVNDINFLDGVLPETFKSDKHIWYQERTKGC